MALSTFFFLIFIRKIPLGKFFPADLVVLVVGAWVAHLFSLPVDFLNQHGEISSQIFGGNGGILEYLGSNVLMFNNIDYSKLSFTSIFLAILTLTAMFVLVYIFNTTSYVSVMKNSELDLGHEFKTIGLTNGVLALFRALPVAPCVAGPVITIGSGMKSKVAIFFVGIWMSAVAIFFPNIIKLIPNPIIYGIFLYYGFAILNVEEVKKIAKYGKSEIAIWAFTFISIISFGFILGFLVSLIAALAKTIYIFSMSLKIDCSKKSDEEYTITMHGAATFLRLPSLSKFLKDAKKGKNIVIDIRKLFYIDHSCLSCLIAWEESLEEGQNASIDWNQLALIYDTFPDGILVDMHPEFSLKRKAHEPVAKNKRKKGVSIEYLRKRNDDLKNKA